MHDKRLVNVGNSLGLIIEKPILRVLGIGTASILRVWCDGRRLIVEPTGERVTTNQHARPLRSQDTPPAPPAQDVNELLDEEEYKSDALAVWRQLVRRWSISEHEFAALHHSERSDRNPRHMIRYEVWCDMDAQNATSEELATIKRMELFLDQLCDGVDRAAALAEALRRFPKQRGVGGLTAPGPSLDTGGVGVDVAQA